MARKAEPPTSSRVPAIPVRQWLDEWSEVEVDEPHRRRPEEQFYLLSLPATTLRRLSGIQRRSAEPGKRRAKDTGIQRRHDPDRSEQISEFVRYGFPWSDLSKTQRKSERFADLRMPGWLPTAIVVNVLLPEDERGGRRVAKNDLVSLETNGDDDAHLALPIDADSNGWAPEALPPLEVIDGQHRLWAFDTTVKARDFQFPVVAFHGLDISWQAYLFWSINIKPKRINASLAFDLYPLLRTEAWLERFEGPDIYKQVRAQELTELLWAHPDSPWHERINMLGERGQRGVSQAAWIRALTATFIKAYEGRGVRVGGLFGAPVGEDRLVLPWTREQQAAFLILTWQRMEEAVAASEDSWAETLREVADEANRDAEGDEDPAFAGPHSLLATDQGVRSFLHVVNDLSFWLSDELGLPDWDLESSGSDDLKNVSQAIEDLDDHPVTELLDEITDTLSGFDWRTASTPGLTDDERTYKLAYRGTGGYRELRRQLLAELGKRADQPARAAAQEVREALGLDADGS